MTEQMDEPARYRKKPVEIDAIRYWPGPDGNCDAMRAFTGDGEACQGGCDENDPWAIETLEGVMEAQPGDWIIRGVKGELYPCKPDVFDATYEPAQGQP